MGVNVGATIMEHLRCSGLLPYLKGNSKSSLGFLNLLKMDDKGYFNFFVRQKYCESKFLLDLQNTGLP